MCGPNIPWKTERSYFFSFVANQTPCKPRQLGATRRQSQEEFQFITMKIVYSILKFSENGTTFYFLNFF